MSGLSKIPCLCCGEMHREVDCPVLVFTPERIPELQRRRAMMRETKWHTVDMENHSSLPDLEKDVLIVVQWQNAGPRSVEVGCLENVRDVKGPRWFAHRLGQIHSGKVLFWMPIPELPTGSFHRCPNCDCLFVTEKDE